MNLRALLATLVAGLVCFMFGTLGNRWARLPRRIALPAGLVVSAAVSALVYLMALSNG